MTRTLILMRHSHSGSSRSSSDFERPLTDEGIDLSRKTGLQLGELGLFPDLLLASAAVRTSATALLIAEQLCPDVNFVTREDLYQARENDYLPAIQAEVTDDIQTLMVVGHNPGIGILIARLTSAYVSVPPATTAIYDLDINSWFDLSTLTDQVATLTHMIVDGKPVMN